jgi:endoglucanase
MQIRSRSFAAAFACAALAALAACSDSATGPDLSAVDRKQPRTPPVDTTTAPTPTPTPSRVFYAGAYLGDAVSNPQGIASAISSFGSMTGKRPALVKTFHSLNCDFTANGWCGQVLRQVATTGATNYVALDLGWTGAPTGGVLDAINAGQADARITAVAQGIRSVGSLVMLEPGWEMNGNWSFSWQGALNGGTSAAPGKYAAAWRRIVGIFRAQGATNVRWVFNPNVGNALTNTASGSTNWNWYANYYPGDTYVDYVGAHGFNGPTVWNTAWQDFGTMTDGAGADHMLSDLAARYPTKPIIIGEMATQEGTAGQKAQWIADAYQKMLANPRVAGAIWFNANKEADWRVESSTSSLQAFQQAMANTAVQVAFTPVAPSGDVLSGATGKLASN